MGHGDVGRGKRVRAGGRERKKRKRRKGWKKNGEEMRRNKDGYTGGSS